MLFSYSYVSHPLASLHSWIEHTVLTVWCRERGVYSVDLLCPELQDLAEAIHNKDSTNRTIFDDIRDIDALIQALPVRKRNELALMFCDSTAVDELCGGANGRTPYSFGDLKSWNPQIAPRLKDFFYDLFDRQIKSGPISKKLGDLKKHVDEFSKGNREGVCPFCGLEETRDENYSTRDPYDHYLPRFKYPFNAVNFRNLVPICHICNSSYKTTKDPISRAAGTRQEAFAPYEPNVQFPEIRVTIDPTKIEALSPPNIEISIRSATSQNKVESWEWLFGIQERYKGKLCKKRGAHSWLRLVLESRMPREVFDNIVSNATKDPLLDDGFLKKPVLEYFESAGLLDPQKP